MGKSGRVVWPSERKLRCKLSVSLEVEAEADTEKGEENRRLRNRRKGEEEVGRVEEKEEMQRLGFMNNIVTFTKAKIQWHKGIELQKNLSVTETE